MRLNIAAAVIVVGIDPSDTAEQVRLAVEQADPAGRVGRIPKIQGNLRQGRKLLDALQVAVEVLESTHHVVVDKWVHEVEMLRTPMWVHLDRRLGLQGVDELLEGHRRVRS